MGDELELVGQNDILHTGWLTEARFTTEARRLRARPTPPSVASPASVISGVDFDFFTLCLCVSVVRLRLELFRAR